MTAPLVRVLATHHPAGSPRARLVRDLVDRLAHHRVTAVVEDPDQHAHDLSAPTPLADLYVLKSGTPTALSLAGALDAVGARIVNPYPVAAACRDKIVQTRALAAAGVPVPQSWLVTDPIQVAPHLLDGPLIVKDPRGSRGRGLHVLHERAGLADLDQEPWLVMRYHPPEGPDLKLYRIGEEIFCVERPFPARTLREKRGRLLPVTAELEAIVRRCGDAFGIDVYGVDVVRHQGRLWVVDMSAFPGFKGVPEAGRRIADVVVDRLRDDAPQASHARVTAVTP